MSTFNPAFHDFKDNLKGMLLKGIHSFEEGFEILDVDLEMDEHLTVDVLAKDAKGNPTVVLMADVEEELLNRTLSTLCQLRHFRYLLQRIYKEHHFDFSVPPRLLLLCPKLSDEFVEKIDFIVAGEIVPYEYSMLKIEGKDYLTFTRKDVDEGGEITAFPVEKKSSVPDHKELAAAAKPAAQTEAKAVPASPGEPSKKSEETKPKKKSENPQAERFFHEAKKKILRISNDIVESVEDPFSRFKIDNRILVTLSRENDEFNIFLGDTSDKRLKIQSEEQLNDALNQIFKRYFTAFSSISKT